MKAAFVFSGQGAQSVGMGKDIVAESEDADLYAAICHENGLTSEMVQKYCPELFAGMFPG